ncbi:uncharacterized protein LOC125042761 isoform X2 [Penaeus chinensis]|uniref:uncharacterized protein LOC125042761 isoform X2 n=1 Tax=Penaeus chinensis TaxID=139456 RepID=UPI001FB632EF|nr:uncharacterized protein LOC125042761 isoform X2 [Penaeus chinensis]
MASFNIPHSLASAKEALKKFSRMAYSVEHIEKFQSAVSIIYGAEYIIETDFLGRMIFCCKICHKPMNNEDSLAEHNRSHFHHMNLDKKMRDKGFEVNSCFKFPSTSLQFKLANSILKPLGLQMIEEYTQGFGPSYYKCILCAAHGKIDPMYHHVIGKKHTEKYIRWRCFLKDSILTSAEREEIRQRLIFEEGVDCTQIRVIKGRSYFPCKWMAQGRPTPRLKAEYFSEASGGKVENSQGLKAFNKTGRKASNSSGIKTETLNPSKSTCSESSSTAASKNKYPPLCKDDKGQTMPGGKQEDICPNLDVRNVSLQKYDLEELMSYLVFIIESHSMPEADLRTPEDVRMAVQLIFKISVALHSIPHTCLANGSCKTPREEWILKAHKDKLEKIMGKIIFFVEPTLKEHSKEMET